MRKEIKQFNEKYPSSKNFEYYWNLFTEPITKHIFKLSLKGILTGSPKWHQVQEILSHKSSIGLDAWKRNTFYELTLKCAGAIHVHPASYMSYPQNIEIGYNVFINRGVYITAPEKVIIGSNVLLGPYVVINSGSHKYNNPNLLIRDQGHKTAPIVISDDVWVGAHACILPGVSIGEGSIVAANSLVAHSVEPYSVVSGIPAKPIFARDKPNN